jgi:predicted nucleic acid-binding protein
MSLGRVFVDTGAWFALQVTDDSSHRVSRDTFPVLVEVCQSLVTSNLVVGETYTLLRLSTGYREAKRFLDKLAQSEKLERERQAYDATSFALMRQERIRYAFAFDSHFRTAGFLRIPVDVRVPS